ncbi:MAG: GDSL-type esterase/lipase family protein [Bacteroidales bacterium]
MLKNKYASTSLACLVFFVFHGFQVQANKAESLFLTISNTVAHAYPFIVYDSNYLHLSPKAELCFDPFFAQLDALKNDTNAKSIQIFHLGDSHIQADFFSNRLRDHAHTFVKLPQQCLRNFIFPYSIAKTNSASAYHFDYGGIWNCTKSTKNKAQGDLGVVGMRLETQDSSAWITISHLNAEGLNQNLSTCKVYHNFGTSIPIPSLWIKQVEILGQSYPELGYTEFQIHKKIDSLEFHFERTAKDSQILFIHGFELSTSSPTCYINNFGVNGASLKSVLACNLLFNQLKISQPNLIILSFGTNDIYQQFDKEIFRTQYQQLLDSIFSSLPSVSIILTTPADFLRSKKYKVPELKEIAKCIQELANTYHCAYWDFYEIGGGYNSMQKWYQAGLANKDKIHFVKNGYQIEADLFFEAFYKAYTQSINKQQP